jgi:hypothetical protein
MAQGSDAPDPLAPHAAHARTTWHMYLVTAVGAAFALAAVSPQVGCAGPSCPFWLRPVVFGIGAIMAGGASFAILRNVVWGSRVDLKRNDIVWWYGPRPGKEKRIAIASIGRIRVEQGEGVTLWLYDRNGRKIFLPTECVRSPVEWGAAMGARFPTIQVELPGRKT